MARFECRCHRAVIVARSPSGRPDGAASPEEPPKSAGPPYDEGAGGCLCCKSCKGVKRSLPSVGAGRRPSPTDESYFSNSNQRPRAEAAFPRPWMHLACLLCGRLPSASDGDPFSLTRRGVNVSLLCVMHAPEVLHCYVSGRIPWLCVPIETRVRILHRGNIREVQPAFKGVLFLRSRNSPFHLHSFA